MTGTYRHGRTYCQVAGCRRRSMRAVEIDLPIAWEGERVYTALTVVVGLCPSHGHDVARRVAALLEARADFPNLLEIIDGAVVFEANQEAQLESMERELGEAFGETDYQRERAALAESALRVVEKDLYEHRCPGKAEPPGLQSLAPAGGEAA